MRHQPVIALLLGAIVSLAVAQMTPHHAGAPTQCHTYPHATTVFYNRIPKAV